MYFKLFIILYADDTVLLCESSEDLQKCINTFEEYCQEWKPEVKY
jgi:hypothetical protein